MSFGLTFDKLLVIGVIALFLIGPDRLPGYAAQLARLVRSLRSMADGAKDRMRDELGPEFDDVDWRKLDPRQYDPRRIIREALLEDPAPGAAAAGSAAAGAAAGAAAAGTAAARAKPATRSSPRRGHIESAYDQRRRKAGNPRPAPFDPEAT
ncbi:MAG: Sec-independent protein translocase TatB [Schumannella sp.]|nr:Sec-independent protein translocase TatB [Microbacteriaceae bacterium]